MCCSGGFLLNRERNDGEIMMRELIEILAYIAPKQLV